MTFQAPLIIRAVTFGSSGNNCGVSLGVDSGMTLESFEIVVQLEEGRLIDCLRDPGRKYFICGGLLQ